MPEHTQNHLLLFCEADNAGLLNATRRVSALVPQIRWYRDQGFSWPVITAALNAIGIQMTQQSLKNVVSSSANSAMERPMATVTNLFRNPHVVATGFEPARPRRTDI